MAAAYLPLAYPPHVPPLTHGRTLSDLDVYAHPVPSLAIDPMHRPRATTPDAHEISELRSPSSGPVRSAKPHARRRSEPRASTSTSPSPAPPEGKLKKPRSRVSNEQLEQLERFFKDEPSPKVDRRKWISEQLGMNERQTQIWFQNR